jgi:putative membrane protein insertion efficiency factor
MIGRALLLRLIGYYSRAISPALPARCRFYPTCSAYAAEAIARHGAGRGTWLALRRLVKCAPWHPGGVDLVPPASGTGGAGHSSSTVHAPQRGHHTTEPATLPASRPAAQEESSVA